MGAPPHQKRVPARRSCFVYKMCAYIGASALRLSLVAHQPCCHAIVDNRGRRALRALQSGCRRAEALFLSKRRSYRSCESKWFILPHFGVVMLNVEPYQSHLYEEVYSLALVESTFFWVICCVMRFHPA